MSDLFASLTLLAVLAGLGVAYGLRVLLRGSARFDRTDQAGGSALLGRGPKEMTYWALQPVGRLCVLLHLGANGITALSLLLGLLAGVAVGAGSFGWAAVLATVSALGDALDGLVARATRTASDAGETFDAAVDRYNEFFFLGGVAFFFRAAPVHLLLAFAALLASFMVSYATAKAEALQVEVPNGAMRRAERAVYLTLGVGFVPITSWATARFDLPPGVAALPVTAALALVALVGNVSAARRLFRVGQLAAAKERARVDATEPDEEKPVVAAAE